jgi:hypothetical protein
LQAPTCRPLTGASYSRPGFGEDVAVRVGLGEVGGDGDRVGPDVPVFFEELLWVGELVCFGGLLAGAVGDGAKLGVENGVGLGDSRLR